MFDPYHKWLGIPKDQQPPTFYRLLGINVGESDPEVIEEAAYRQTQYVRTHQIGPHAAECTKLLNEIAKAKATLLNPSKRKAYDASLPAAKEAVVAKLAPTAVRAAPIAQAKPAAANPHVAAQRPTPPALGQTPTPPSERKLQVRKKGINPLVIYGGLGGVAVIGIGIALAFAFSGPGTPKTIVKNTPPAKKKDFFPVENNPNPTPPVIPPEKTEKPVKPPSTKKPPEPPPQIGSLPGVKLVYFTPRKTRPIAAGNIFQMQPSADGQRILTAGPEAGLGLYEAATGTEIRRYFDPADAKMKMNDAVFSADEASIYACGQNGTLYKFQTDSGKLLQSWQDTDASSTGYKRIHLAPDGQQLLTVANNNNFLTLWKVPSGDKVRKIDIDNKYGAGGFSPDGKTVAIGDLKGGLKLYDTSNWQAVKSWPEPTPTKKFTALIWEADGKTILASRDNLVERWTPDMETPTIVWKNGPNCAWLTLNAAGDLLGIGDEQGGYNVVDLPGKKSIRGQRLAGSPTRRVLFADKDESLLVAGHGLWSVDWRNHNQGPITSAEPEKEVTNVSRDTVTHVGYTADGMTAYAMGRSIYFWDGLTGEAKHVVRIPAASTYSMGVSRDGQFAAVGSQLGCHLIDVAENKVLWFQEHDQPVRAVAFSADGALVATLAGKSKGTAAEDCFIRVWDRGTGQLHRKSSPISFLTDQISFRNSGKEVFGTFQNQQFLSWKVDDGAQVRSISISPPFTSTRLDTEGNYALILQGGSMSLLNLNGVKIEKSLLGHYAGPAGATFAIGLSDNLENVVLGMDVRANWWSMKTGCIVRQLQLDQGCSAAAIHPQGTTALIASQGATYFWKPKPPE